MEPRKYQVAAVIGTTQSGDAYSYELGAAIGSLDREGAKDREKKYETLDRFEKNAQDRLVLHMGRKETGDLVITSIVRSGTSLTGQTDEAANNEASANRIDEMEPRARFPDRAEIHGVLFEVGGPARGIVIDEKRFEEARPAFNVYHDIEAKIDRQDRVDSQVLLSAFRTVPKNLKAMRGAGSGPGSATPMNFGSVDPEDPFFNKDLGTGPEPQA